MLNDTHVLNQLQSSSRTKASHWIGLFQAENIVKNHLTGILKNYLCPYGRKKILIGRLTKIKKNIQKFSSTCFGAISIELLKSNGGFYQDRMLTREI